MNTQWVQSDSCNFRSARRHSRTQHLNDHGYLGKVNGFFLFQMENNVVFFYFRSFAKIQTFFKRFGLAIHWIGNFYPVDSNLGELTEFLTEWSDKAAFNIYHLLTSKYFNIDRPLDNRAYNIFKANISYKPMDLLIKLSPCEK